MTDTRTRSQPASDAEVSCPACQQPASGERCNWCGAALGPGGLRIQSVISQGPHGRVYLAEDEAGRAIALKELQFAQVPSTHEIDAFEREAKTLAQLDHPRIPRFYRSFSEGTGVHLRLYLAAEFIRGESLARRIARGALGEKDARDLARQVLEVLAYLHGRSPPLVHRDVKPENLIVRPDGSVVLVDFGTARQLSGTRTFGSTLVGTFGYMAPEQLGGTVDPTSDLYALGATLLHAVTGRPPGEWLHGDLELTIPESVPPGLRPFLEAVLQRDAARRPRTAKEALAILEGRQRSQRPRRWRRRLRFALLLAVGLALSRWGGALDSWWSGPATVSSTTQSELSGLRYGSEAAKRWFLGMKPRCNALEVEQAIRGAPPPSGWDGAGYAASCYALAGRIDQARASLEAVDPGEQARAAAILFELGHPIADSGDDVSAAQIMNLVLEFWPQNYQARYHAGMSDYALGRTEQAKANLEEFLREYHQDDGFTRAAREVLDRIQRGLPAERKPDDPTR